MLSVVFEILMHDVAGYMLAPRDTIDGGVHAEIAELVGAIEIVRFEARIDSPIGPYPADCLLRVEHCHACTRIYFEIRFGGYKAVVAWRWSVTALQMIALRGQTGADNRETQCLRFSHAPRSMEMFHS